MNCPGSEDKKAEAGSLGIPIFKGQIEELESLKDIEKEQLED